MIQTYINSVRQAIKGKNWYCALAFALALPDICGGLHQPSEQSSKKRFVDWYDQWYRRLGHVSGDPKVRNLMEADAGHLRMDQSRLASLAREFEIDYAVFEQPFDGRQLQAEVVFTNKRYLVLKPGATSEDSAGQK